VQIINCRASGGAAYPGFRIAGGNAMVADCKAYYRGNETGVSTGADGFVFSSSRFTVTGCSAQDNGGYGFVFSGVDGQASNCQSDANSNGFQINASGSYDNLSAISRTGGRFATATSFTVTGTTTKVYLTGRSNLAATGSAHNTGTPMTNSYVRVVREGGPTGTPVTIWALG
jgi:hypothetical protein